MGALGSLSNRGKGFKSLPKNAPDAPGISRGHLRIGVMKELKSQGSLPNSPGAPGGSSRDKRPSGLNTEIQARIGHQLRAMYDDVVRQGVPDRFSDLIRKLDDPNAVKPTPKAEGSD
jgi:hypothetical protein